MKDDAKDCEKELNAHDSAKIQVQFQSVESARGDKDRAAWTSICAKD